MNLPLRILFSFLALAFACLPSLAQTHVWQPAPGRAQIPIWPGAAPDSQPVPGPEYATNSGSWTAVENVSRPTLTVYPARGKNTGTAVVVFPGGGYSCLAIDLEGTEVCDWLASRGITAVLLKYRVPALRRESFRTSRMALDDAQRTIRLARFHAAEWRIDPRKIGVIGFSAGGHLVAATSTEFSAGLYPPVDAADKLSCRPDFAIACYPGHLWDDGEDGKSFTLNPQVTVTKETPPTFLLQAENDPVDSINNSLVYYVALKNAGVPVEMHLYAQGKHGFGLRRTPLPITEWPGLVEKWLVTIGLVSQR